jgi:hypothetical protein
LFVGHLGLLDSRMTGWLDIPFHEKI